MDKKNERPSRISVSGMAISVMFVVIMILSIRMGTSFIEIGSKLLWKYDKNFYSNIGICFSDDDYIVSPNAETSCDYEFEQLCALKERLDEAGIKLLYVNKPTKYIDDTVFNQFGLESYCNANADLLISRLREADIDVLDLRDEMERDGIDIHDMFYRTDHHWDVPHGKWGAEKIAQRLNDNFGYDIDLSIYDDKNFVFEKYKEVWLGEQGRKFQGSALKKDDYTIVYPNFETHYSFDGGGDFTFMSFLSSYPPFYHYIYNHRSCVNNSVEKGSVMFFGDSFDAVTVPFLSLGIHDLDFHLLRDECRGDFDVYDEWIAGKDIDTVIVCYVEFMIGQHDDPKSANHYMFTFTPDGRQAATGNTHS